MNRQPALRPVQRLDRSLFVRAKHQGVFGRIEIQPHHVQQLLGKMRIVADLERLGPMRLKSVGLPNALHHRGRRAQRLGQGSRTPMRRVGGLFLSGFLDDGVGNSRSCFGRPSATRRVFFDARQPPFGEPRAPKRNRFASGLQRFGDVLVHHAIRREQDDFGSQHQTCRRSSSASPAVQRSSFVIRKRDLSSVFHGFLSPYKDETPKTPISSAIYVSLH